MTQNNEAKVLTPEQIENNKQQIIDIYRNYVKREGSDKLLDYLITAFSERLQLLQGLS